MRFGAILVLCTGLLLLGCKDGSNNTGGNAGSNTGDSGTNSGNTGNDTANKPKPTPSLNLSANDVSILLPPPLKKEDMANTISVSELGNALPDAAFQNMLALANGPFGKANRFQINMGPGGAPEMAQKAVWHISGIRIDPSAPGASNAIRREFGTSPQIRLILSPVTGVDQPVPRVHDFALHLIYSYITGVKEPAKAACRPRPEPDRAKFKQIVDDLVQLKKDLAAGKIGGTEVKTDGLPLNVHPGLANESTKAGTRERIKSFLSKHLPQGNLVAMAVMGLDGGAPEPWIFLAMAFDPAKKAFVPVPSPSVLQPLAELQPGGDPRKMLFGQALSFITPRGVLPEPVNNNMNPTTCETITVAKDKRVGVSTAELFGQASKERVRPVVDIVADPTKSHFFNTDCVSCHTETHREMELLSTATFDGIADEVLPQSNWNVRNFGWFKSIFVSGPARATVTRRTETETK